MSAILGLLFSVLTLFSANQPGAAVLVTLLDYWTVHTLIAFVLLAALAGVGAYRRVWSAIVGSVLAAVAAALLGSLVGAMGQGGSAHGRHRRPAPRDHPRSQPHVRPRREPRVGAPRTSTVAAPVRRRGGAPARAGGAGAHPLLASGRWRDSRTWTGSPSTRRLADQQWERYVLALEEHGWATREVPPADANPDSVFVEDAVVVLGGTAVVLTSGADSRRGERPGWSRPSATSASTSSPSTSPPRSTGETCSRSAAPSTSAAARVRTPRASVGSARSWVRSATPSSRSRCPRRCT
ncbi:hypothetical protein [Clavibacter tessellarius]|uniref:hypothetical protein n=1 Tax=Clavibacter tessellarius TaxID=31965 RepID=UPI00325231DF